MAEPAGANTAAQELQTSLDEISRERDDATRVLREREDELARIQRIGRVGGLVVDFTDGFKNSRSPEYLAIHGLPANATNESHESWVSRIHPEDRDAVVQRFLYILKSVEDDYLAEYRIVRPNDGATRWISATGKVERDASGRALRLVGAHVDITERMQAEQALRESEERFRLIADSAPVPIWVTKIDRTRAFANQAYLDFLGLPFDEAVSFDWRKVLHGDDLDRILREQIAGESSLKPFVLEARYRRADGEWRWLRSESQPRWDPSGQHVGFIGVAHDITASKLAETELRSLNEFLEQRIKERTAQLESNEAQLRAIFETSNQYQGLLDVNGRVLHMNQTALAGAGVTAGEVVGQLFWDTRWFKATEAAGDVAKNAFMAAMRGDTVRQEIRLSLPAGERYFEFAMRPVFDMRGNVSGAVPEALDITERRQSEAILRQSQKMEAVGQLTGGVAHDFNNLLTIIRSATDFLRRRELPEERRRRYIDAISDTVERASKLTAQLLAFARRQPLKPEVFDVGAQVQIIADLIRPVVGAGVAIEIVLESEDCFAVADIAQFETALINLAVNARDAMNGDGRLVVEVSKTTAIPALRNGPARPGNFIAIAVRDTGAGIAPDKLDQIFEPFYTTKEVGKGTGLGLSQAFGFAKQSEGDIAVASLPGAGATFTIYLPRAAAMAAHPIASQPGVEPGASGRGNSILVVEDNADVGKFSTELLQDLGYRIDWVENGEQALAFLARDEFAVDLVFSDVIMPGMNGVELAVLIRDRYPGLPVVLTSGYSDVLAENADRGFELIQKPYSVEALSRTIRRAITAKAAAPRR